MSIMSVMSDIILSSTNSLQRARPKYKGWLSICVYPSSLSCILSFVLLASSWRHGYKASIIAPIVPITRINPVLTRVIGLAAPDVAAAIV